MTRDNANAVAIPVLLESAGLVVLPRVRPASTCVSLSVLIGSKNELHTVHVDRTPIGPMNQESETLFAALVEHHDRSAATTVLNHLLPKALAGALGHLPDEYAGRDLQEPTRDVSTKPRGAGSQDKHYHGASWSA